MGFIANAVSAIASFSIGGFSVGRTILGVGLSLGLNAVSRLLAPKPKAAPSAGTQLNLQLGGDVGRQIVFGRTATRGHLAFFNTSGANNERLDLVYILSEGWCDGLEAAWAGGEKKVLTSLGNAAGGAPRYQIEGYGSAAEITFHDGRPGQGADDDLIAHSGGRLTGNDHFTGMCYVHVRLIYDERQFTGGLPEFSWQLRGYRCYDVRKDATAGGAGAHRLTDPATWEWTENPAIHAYNFLAGCQAAGVSVLGPCVPAYDLEAASFRAAANICDETVALEGGGTEPRYRCNAIVTGEDSDFRSQLAPIIQAMAGYILESQGSFAILAGVAQLPVVTITDGDLRINADRRLSLSLSRTQRANEVYGQFIDTKAGWQPNSYPPVISAADRAEDGEALRLSDDLGAVPSVSQAQRIAKARLRETRAQANGAITLGYHLLFLDPGDWIAWQSDRFGWTKLFRVTTRQRNSDDSIAVELREVNNAIYAWATSDEKPVALPGVAPGQPGYMTTVSNFAAKAIMIDAPSGARRPGVELTWAAIADPTVDAVIIEYRRINAVAATRLRDDSPRDGRFIIEAIGSGDQYEFRASIATTPMRPTAWTGWVGVQTGQARLAPGSVSFDAMARSVHEAFQPPAPLRHFAVALIKEVQQSWTQETQGHVAGINASASFIQQTHLQAGKSEALASKIEKLEANVGENIQAQIKQEAKARAAADEAISQKVETIKADLGPDIKAQIKGEAVARTKADEAIAQEIKALGVSFNSQITAGIKVETEARAAALGGISREIKTISATADGAEASVRAVSQTVAGIDGKLEGTYSIAVNARGELAGLKFYNDGSASTLTLKAKNIQVQALSEITMNTGKLNISGDVNIGNAIFFRSGSNPRIEIYDNA